MVVFRQVSEIVEELEAAADSEAVTAFARPLMFSLKLMSTTSFLESGLSQTIFFPWSPLTSWANLGSETLDRRFESSEVGFTISLTEEREIIDVGTDGVFVALITAEVGDKTVFAVVLAKPSAEVVVAQDFINSWENILRDAAALVVVVITDEVAKEYF